MATVAILGMVCVGCFGGDNGGDGPPATTGAQPPATATTTTVVVVVDEDAEYSTFRSKDPFISQAQGGGTTPTGGPDGPTPTTRPGQPTNPTSSTTVRPTITTIRPSSTTTTQGTGGGTSTTDTTQPQSTTTTTAPHVHTLKVLGVGQAGGAAVVTLQVDSSVYKDKHIGSVVSTSWGQIKILDINSSSKVVTLMHGSETLNLVVGQAIYQ